LRILSAVQWICRIRFAENAADPVHILCRRLLKMARLST
jgi:hypothetical protein